MNAFVLKIIAIVTMTFDHTGYLIFGDFSYFNYIGRLAFPIFAFQISQGYIHTKNLKKYLSRLLIFAVISQIPFTLFLCSRSEVVPISEIPNILYNSFILWSSTLNIFFTLIIGLIAIIVYDNFNKLREKIHCRGEIYFHPGNHGICLYNT